MGLWRHRWAPQQHGVCVLVCVRAAVHNACPLTLYFSLLGSFFTISSSTRQSAPGVSFGMHLRAQRMRGGDGSNGRQELWV